MDAMTMTLLLSVDDLLDLDIEAMNDMVADEHGGVAQDISYRAIDVDADGLVLVKVWFSTTEE